MPNCGIIFLLYIFSTKLLYLVASNCSFDALGRRVLNVWIGIMLPKLYLLYIVLVYYNLAKKWKKNIYQVVQDYWWGG